MFIFSREQLGTILPPSPSPSPPLLMDIGAGDGHVTDVIKSVLSPSVVCVTETSRVMKRVLTRRGFRWVGKSKLAGSFPPVRKYALCLMAVPARGSTAMYITCFLQCILPVSCDVCYLFILFVTCLFGFKGSSLEWEILL